MRKILDGVLYDTETAQHLYTDEVNNKHRDFYNYRKECYRKENGEYFIVYSGGPCSPYKIEHPNGDTTGDEGILPVVYIKDKLLEVRYDIFTRTIYDIPKLYNKELVFTKITVEKDCASQVDEELYFCEDDKYILFYKNSRGKVKFAYLNENCARRFVEFYGTVEEYESIFGAVSE